MKSITVLKLKLSDPPAELAEVARLCRNGRNAAVEDWLLRQRGKPETAKQRGSGRPGKGSVERPKSESTKIYHAVTAAVPDLNTQMASSIAGAVASNISSKLDWRRSANEDGKKRRRADAILAYEDRAPFLTALEIPVPNNQTKVRFGDRISIRLHKPLKSAEPLEIELSLRGIPPATQLVLRELADGTRKLADSKLVYKDEKGEWYWHVPVTFETEVRSDVTASLFPVLGKSNKPTDRPYRLELPSGRTWWIGDGRYLLAQVTRLVGLRKMIGWRYRQRMGAGHGRKKIDDAVRKRRNQERNIVAEVRRRAIADIVRQCVRSNVGTLIYREPSLPLREKCWFKAVGLDWDWTRFCADLKNSCARQGIGVKVERLKWKDAINDEA